MKLIQKCLVVLLSLLLAGSVLAGCGGRGNSQTATDDIVEILYRGWNNLPIENSYVNNPYKEFIDKKYNFDYRVSLSSDFTNEVSKRFASTKTRLPDIVMFETQDYAAMKSLYNQGFFIEDYTPYLDSLPQYKALFENNLAAKAKLTENGNIIALTREANDPVWMHKIRKDWVEKYANGKIPATVDELLAMAENVKKDSKAGDEKYLFTAAGSRKDIGDLHRFQFMFGDYDDWYVKDGEVSHPILDGTHEKFLKFCRTLYEKDYIDPNFLLQDWTQKKTLLHNGHIGIDYYTPAIATEQIFYNNTDESQTNIWMNMPMPTDTAGVTRGGVTQETFQYYFVINKKLTENEEKFASVLQFLNDMLYPEDEAERNESTYMKIRWGVDVDNYEIGEGKEMEPVLRDGKDTGFITYYYQKNPQNHARPTNGATWDYGVPMATTNDKVVEYLGATSYGQSAYDYIDLYNGALEYNLKNPNFNYGEMVNISSRIESKLTDLLNEFETTYILGTASRSYEEFRNTWLQYGGETAKRTAEQQFRAAGLLK